MPAFVFYQQGRKWLILNTVSRVTYEVSPNTKNEARRRCLELNDNQGEDA